MKTVRKIALRSAAVLAASLAVNAASADAPVYTMTVFTDSAHGSKVVSGDYDKAIDRLERAEARFADSVAGQTNLCVAYLKSGDMDKAIDACTAAVEVIESDQRLSLRSKLLAEDQRLKLETELAIALSNRGVMHAAKGNAELAEADFLRAAELDVRSVKAPTINLARLQR